MKSEKWELQSGRRAGATALEQLAPLSVLLEDPWRHVTRCVDLWVPGLAVPQPRARRSRWGGVYTPESVRPWKVAIRAAMMQARVEDPQWPPQPIDSPVAVKIVVLMPRPERLQRCSSPPGLIPHAVKPDVDNLAKAILDALNPGRRAGTGLAAPAWTDDARVFALEVLAFWTTHPGGVTGAAIRIGWRDAT